MRHLILGVLLSACVAASAQESPQPVAGSDAQAETLESYLVQLSEYRLDRPADASKTAAEIVALLTTSNAEQRPAPVETIRLSTLSGHESMVQFGKQITVASGMVSNRGSTTRQMQTIQTGTIVRITATPQADKVGVEILFESSRLSEEDSDDAGLNISTTEINTILLLEFGKPTLIGGLTSESSTFILITITR